MSGGDDGVVISDHSSLLIQCSPDVFRKREQALMCRAVIESQAVTVPIGQASVYLLTTQF